MAIWNDSTISEKCSNCGANIYFDENIQKLTCRYCGSVFDPETKKLDYKLDVRDKGEAAVDDMRVEFTCGSCGSIMVTSDTTAATTCAFCGSPALIKDRLRNEFQPDSIIPFKISKEEAVKCFRQWASAYKKAPKNFASSGTLKNLRGVYVPFWLIDADCQISFEYQYEGVYEYDFTLRKVPCDGGKKISDVLMQAIEPFDYSELVPYKDGYLQGFVAKRYDDSVVDSLGKITGRINKYLREVFTDSIKPTLNTEGDVYTSSINNLSQQYALLPVWILNYEYDGNKYTYVINGQTGKVQGLDIPYAKIHSFKDYFIKYAKIAGFSALILALFSPILYLAINDFALYVRVIPGAFIFEALFLAVPFIVLFLIAKKFFWPHLKHEINKPVYHIIDKAPSVNQYFDTTSLKKSVKSRRK